MSRAIMAEGLAYILLGILLAFVVHGAWVDPSDPIHGHRLVVAEGQP